VRPATRKSDEASIGGDAAVVHRFASFALIALTSFAQLGCYDTNARDTDAAIDARLTIDGASMRDASVPDAFVSIPDVGVDAFVPPVDAACPTIVERNVRMCVLTPTGTLPEREPYTLRVTRSTCRCEARVCDVRVEGDRIRLGITACDTGMPCDECTNDAECTIPPLRSGVFQVIVDDVHAGFVEVAPRRMVSDATPACWAIPETPEVPLECVGDVIPTSTRGEICFRALEDVGSFVRFQLTYACAGCEDWSGGCEAIRESRRSILLRPAVQRCACRDCPSCAPDVCVPRTVTCETPPLRDGLYDVDVEDLGGGRRNVGALEVLDIDVPGPIGCVPMP